MRKQKASEIRFLLIFDRFGSHLGPPKRTQNRLKMASKNRCKNEASRIAFLGRLGGFGADRGGGEAIEVAGFQVP